MKSDVSNLLEVAQSVYLDGCAKCTADVSDLRDLETIRARVKSEGISFLTITLPQFCSDFERSLALGRIDSTCFRSFRKQGSIPAFLQGMISQLFDRETGNYDSNSASRYNHSVIVECVRQICLTFKKLELACSPLRVKAAINSFESSERDLSTSPILAEDRDRFIRVSSVLWDNLVFGIANDTVIPRHGPGTTAEGISGNRKFSWQYWTERLERYFPLIDSAYSISAFDSEELNSVNVLSEEQEWPVKVTPVPKTLKGPRIIAIEPCCMQYAQQGLQKVLYRALEENSLTRGHLNFDDQSVNKSMALVGSKDGRLTTIDLSEASDRVPLSLAIRMFDANPDFRDAVLACRSTHAKLPDGTIIGPLLKFASMGSALCFPIESMYFYTICVATLLQETGLPVSQKTVKQVSRDIYVYGDDIIVPTSYAKAVLDNLQKYNCKVNTNKTFFSGNFRESCGMDAYDGKEVTPTYLRQLTPQNRRQDTRLISWVASANLFYKKGYWKTSSTIFSIVERILGPLPYVSEQSPILGRITFLGLRSIGRWNRKFHSFEIRGWAPSPVYRTDKLEGYAALQKSLSGLHFRKDLWEPRDPLHLERTARFGVAALKRQWVPVY